MHSVRAIRGGGDEGLLRQWPNAIESSPMVQLLTITSIGQDEYDVGRNTSRGGRLLESRWTLYVDQGRARE